MTRETTSDWAPGESWRTASVRSGASPGTWACTSRRRRRPEQARRWNWASTQVDSDRRSELRRRPLRCRERKFVSWTSRKRRAESKKKEMEAQMRGQNSHFLWRVCMSQRKREIKLTCENESQKELWICVQCCVGSLACHFTLFSAFFLFFLSLSWCVLLLYVCYCLFNSSHVIQMCDANMSLNILIYEMQRTIFGIILHLLRLNNYIQNLNSKYSHEWNFF